MAAVAAAGFLAACGGGSEQNAGEPSGDFKVALKATFPHKQKYAINSVMDLTVTNRSGKTLQNVTATVDGFYQRSTQEGMQDPQEAVWIVNQGPVGGVTALTNTWALGSLADGASRTFTWHVTPMVSGRHMLHYRVSGSLYGESKAVLANGEPAEGHIRVAVSPRPSKTEVDPATGDVVVVGSTPNAH
jgi:hypothetical protein